jgi:hypothetical protein
MQINCEKQKQNLVVNLFALGSSGKSNLRQAAVRSWICESSHLTPDTCVYTAAPRAISGCSFGGRRPFSLQLCCAMLSRAQFTTHASLQT